MDNICRRFDLESTAFTGAEIDEKIKSGFSWIFVVGSFPNADWKHIVQRKLTYKGNNVYQVVTDEVAGKYKMQYAAEQWKPQFTAKGKKLIVGQLNELTYGGYGTDTKLEIKEPGKYLWSLEFKDNGSPYSIMISKCQ